MVLKKSNSCFNTGTTQRVIGGCARTEGRFGVEMQSECISITLDGHQIQSKENMTAFQDALDEIYDFLEWQGPQLSEFYDSLGNPKEQELFNRFLYSKTQKGRGPSLVDKVREIISTDTLEAIVESESVEVNIKFLKHSPRHSIRRPEVVSSWTSTKKKRGEKDCDTKKNRKLERRKRQQTRIGRGVQRQNKFSRQTSERQTSPIAPLRKINIDVKDHAMDARLVNYVEKSRKKHIEPDIPGKSCWKHKGFVNGVRSYFKGYNYNTLKLDEMEAHGDGDGMSEEDDEDYDDQSVPVSFMTHKGICLSDYIVSTGREKSRNRNNDSQTKKSDTRPVNSASSDRIMKHPKGSCVFLTETKEEPCNISDVDSGLNSSSSDLPESFIGKQSEEWEFIDIGSQAVISQLDLSSEIIDFFSKLRQIQLTLPSEFRSRCQKFSSKKDPCNCNIVNEKYSMKDCDIIFGNCYPPTFLMRISPEKGKVYDHTFSLTGRVFEMLGDDIWACQIQIGNMNETDCLVGERFSSTLASKLCTQSQITLENLVEMFQESTTLDSHLNENYIKSEPNLDKVCHPRSNQSAWLSLKRYIPNYAKTVSVEEALTSLNLLSPSSTEPQRDNAKDALSNDPKPDDSSSSSTSTCDICLLPCDFSQPGDSQAIALTPCGHVFCAHCWSSHVCVGLGTADPIHCMAFDCEKEVNEAVLRSLASGHKVNKWHGRLQHKAIERSPGCKWCPNTRCHKVAVIEKLSPEINQFGALVLCACATRWCFSCQKEPHWPASCQQMAAFRKLLAKAGNSSDIPVGKVDFTVELKPCPKCHYPIEKNDGCPSMVCRMCWFNFCWNCLRAVDHVVYTCKPQRNNFVTYHLVNHLVRKLPFKFFPDFQRMNKKREKVATSFRHYQHCRIQLSKAATTTSRPPCSGSLKQTDMDAAKQAAISLFDTCLQFREDVYTLLESYYVLLAFVSMHKPQHEISHIMQDSVRLADRLEFIVWRLEERILGSTLMQIIKNTDIAKVLLQSGRSQINVLKYRVPSLLSISKNIDPKPVGDIDLDKNLRYK